MYTRLVALQEKKVDKKILETSRKCIIIIDTVYFHNIQTTCNTQFSNIFLETENNNNKNGD